MVQERRGAPVRSHAEHRLQNVRVLASQVVLDSALVESLTECSSQEGPWCSATGAHAAVQRPERRGGAQRHRGARLHETHGRQRRGSKIHSLANPGQDVAPIGAARQKDSLLESQMQLGSLQYPHNPMKGASEHFHFLSVLAGTYDDTVRNIDIGRVGFLRHSFIAGFPTERVPKMPLSGVSTRSGDLAGFTFKGLDGTMTDLFSGLPAGDAPGTGVSVLD